MKNLVMIVHAGVQQDLADCLRGLGQIQEFTFSHVEGHGRQAESDHFLSARDKVVGYTPRVRVDILLQDDDVQVVLDAVRSDVPGITGRCMYWVADVARWGEL